MKEGHKRQRLEGNYYRNFLKKKKKTKTVSKCGECRLAAREKLKKTNASHRNFGCGENRTLGGKKSQENGREGFARAAKKIGG